ncbi:hypothetical protein BDN72DRAFT_962431, partial [Pluteus cervinus]
MDAPYHVDEYSYTRNDAFNDDQDASFMSRMRFTPPLTSAYPLESRQGAVPQPQTGDYASTSATTTPRPMDETSSGNSSPNNYRRPHRRPRTQRPVVLFERHVQQLELEARQREATSSPTIPRYPYNADEFEQPLHHISHEYREPKLQLQPLNPVSFYAVQPYRSDNDHELQRRQYYGQLRTNSIYKQREEEVEVNWTFDTIFDQIMVLRDEAAEKERWGG